MGTVLSLPLYDAHQRALDESFSSTSTLPSTSTPGYEWEFGDSSTEPTAPDTELDIYTIVGATSSITITLMLSGTAIVYLR